MRIFFAAMIIALVGLNSCNDFFQKLNQLKTEDLIEFALKAQSIDRKNKGIDIIFGGLEDYIRTLTREEIIDQILEFARHNPELLTFAEKFNFSNLSFNELKKLALECEAYEKSEKKLPPIGGLHDFIEKLIREDIEEIFRRCLSQNPNFNIKPIAVPALGKDPVNSLENFLLSLKNEKISKLRKIAVAVDEESRLKHPRVGGIADRVSTMSESELFEFIALTVTDLGFNFNIDELIKKHQDRIRFSEEIANVIPQTHHKKNLRSTLKVRALAQNLTKEQLKELAIIADELIRKSNHKRGGIAERIENITNDEIFAIIEEAEKSFPQTFNIENLDNLAIEFEERIKFAKEYAELSKNGSKLLFESRDDSIILNSLKIEDLEALAIIVDEYVREIELRFGGIAEVVHNLTPADLERFIIEKFEKYPELRNLELLDSLKVKYQQRIDFANRIIDVVKPQVSSPAFDITKYLNRLTLNQLREIAVALDEHDKKFNPRMGGLAEFVKRLQKEELVEIIQKYISVYSEFNSIEGLLEIVKSFDERNNFSKEYNSKLLNDILRNYSKNQLVQIALGLEKHYNSKNNIDVIGGLHDYVAQLDEAQLIAKIAEFADELPEAFDAKFIESLVKNSKEPSVLEIIRSQPRETLIIIATTLEAFERKTTGNQLFGGIHDNAPRLTDEELFIFIEDIINRFPQLQTIGNLEKVLDEFTQ